MNIVEPTRTVERFLIKNFLAGVKAAAAVVTGVSLLLGRFSSRLFGRLIRGNGVLDAGLLGVLLVVPPGTGM